MSLFPVLPRKPAAASICPIIKDLGRKPCMLRKDMMPLKRLYEPRDGYLLVRVEGSYDLEDSITGINEALKHCEEHDLYKILIDFREVRGEVPLFTEGYMYASKVAQQVAQHKELTGRELRIAFVGPELREVDTYSEKVAKEQGLTDLIVTSDMDHALEWLEIETE
jgi:hypothetical protein